MKFWGELHSHNNVGYGKGSIGRALSIAHATLDVCAVTPHAWWPDLPDNDVREKHIRGFRRTADRWAHTLGLVHSHNSPGEFVTLPAYEWHSFAWGDFCLHFPGGYPEIARVSTFEELVEFAQENGALVIPHHCAYPVGRRGTNWWAVGEHNIPVCEIFSEHGSSLESPSPYPMYGHSMGGSRRSQTVLHQLKGGRRMGFLAGTDNHYGHPGAYGEGLTAILADTLDRASVFEAVQRGHTYAVTGDRIDIDFRLGDGIPGDQVEAVSPLRGFLEVRGRAPLERVDIIKNGHTWIRFGDVTRPGTPAEGSGERFVRFEWGWDGLDATEITEWTIRFRLHDGEIRDVEPCFGSGPDTYELTPGVERIDSSAVQVISHTSRTNPRPVEGVIFECSADSSALWDIEVRCARGNQVVEKQIGVRFGEILEDDVHIGISESFSFPRMKIHAVPERTESHVITEWHDDDPRPGDFYFAYITQKNGQAGWTSPVWCR